MYENVAPKPQYNMNFEKPVHATGCRWGFFETKSTNGAGWIRTWRKLIILGKIISKDSDTERGEAVCEEMRVHLFV